MELSDNRQADVSETVTLIIVCAVQFLTPFMMSAVGVALPSIGREFDASAAQLGLVETVYILAVALLLLPCGRLADIYGRKRIFISGIVFITVATLLISLCWSMEVFILFRFVQGAGAAMITGTSVAILSSVFPPERRGRAMGVIVACVYVGLSAGPFLSGVMVIWMGWRWIFYLSVPVEIAAFFLTLCFLKGEWAESRGERFDITGSVIYILSLFLLIVGVLNQDKGGHYYWMIAFGITGLLLFLVVEARVPYPVLDVRLLYTNRVFTFSNIATMINYAASFGVIFFFSLYLQYIKGYTPQVTGYVLIIQPIIQACFSPVFGRLSDKYPPARLATIGMMICAVGLGLASFVTGDTSVMVIISMLGILGAGFSVFSSPNMTTVMGSVQPRHYGIASSLVATMRTSGMLISMTIITVLFTYFLGDRPVTSETREAFLQSMRISFIVFCGLSIIGVIVSTGRIERAH